MGRIWWAAASLIFILLVSGTSDFWMPQAEQVVMGWIQVERSVAPGITQQYQLPDGTNVCLNAGSKLTYPRFFLGHSREVKLSGEAFFEVTHNVQKPFIIHSGGISTRVLGTSFNIRAYEGIDHTTVTVATGRVQVSQDDRLLSTLTANQEITVDNLSGKFTLLDHVKTDKRLAWQTGRLVFDNAHIDDVIAELSNRYNVKFDDGLANLQGKYVTADFDSGTTLSQVLNVVADIDKLNFSINDSVIVITNQKQQ